MILIVRGLDQEGFDYERRVLKRRNYIIWVREYIVIGDKGEEGPPVPIPNTEVKLLSVEDT